VQQIVESSDDGERSGHHRAMIEPSSHYTEVNSLRLHYLESGAPDPNVPPILLLHDFPTSWHLYRNILPELGKTHRAIALDLAGYGLRDSSSTRILVRTSSSTTRARYRRWCFKVESMDWRAREMSWSARVLS
jgi:pimeloyl-ACP methyl ester carboxylesterase